MFACEMNDLVALLASTPPTAAGAGTRASNAATNAATGDGKFADVLAQVQPFTSDGTSQPDPEATLLPMHLPQPLIQAASALSTGDLAAQLQAAFGNKPSNGVFNLGDVLATLRAEAAAAPQSNDLNGQGPQIAPALIAPALIAPPAPIPVQAPPPPVTSGDAGTAPQVAPPAIGLRGTLVEDPPPVVQGDIKASDTAIDRATAPVATLTAVPRPKSDAGQQGGTSPSPTTPKTDDAANTPPLDAVPQAAAAAGQPPNAAPAPSTQGDALTSSLQPFATVTTSTQRTLIDMQAMSNPTTVTPQAAVPLDALAVHIARKFEAGTNQFEIRLHPAELGHLDISLSVAEDGHVQAVLRAERPETLDLLQRDARVLEQQLRQAGLEVGSNALSFSLSSGNGQRQSPFLGWPAFAEASDTGAAKQDAASTYIAVRKSGGIDIRI